MVSEFLSVSHASTMSGTAAVVFLLIVIVLAGGGYWAYSTGKIKPDIISGILPSKWIEAKDKDTGGHDLKCGQVNDAYSIEDVRKECEKNKECVAYNLYGEKSKGSPKNYCLKANTALEAFPDGPQPSWTAGGQEIAKTHHMTWWGKKEHWGDKGGKADKDDDDK